MPGFGHATQQTNRYLLVSYIEPEFREAPVREVTPLRVFQWVDGLALAPTTKASIRSIISQCFELGALHGYLPAFERNPMSLVKIKGRSKRQKKITRLHIGQVRKLLEKLPEPINILTFVTASLGLRISETLALRWSDIDWKEKEISIVRKFTHGALGETKTDASSARLPVDAGLAKVLAAWKMRSKGTEWIFPSSRTGGPRSASMLLQKGLAPAVKELGLGRVTWHTLRHAYHAWIDAAKTPVGIQKDLMRHADPAMTLKYGSALSEDMRKAHDSVARKLIPANLLQTRRARTKQRR